MVLSDKSPFSVKESYKTLRTNVSFSLPGSDCKCIGVVSANRGDGKSSVALNLAISFFQINKKVVLIDCDMRLPTISTKLGIDEKCGLSNYLSGGVDSIPIIHLTDKGIDVIVSGNIPPDPTSLISSNEMVKLVTELKKEYDYIIFDFPPINVVSDSVMISSLIDGYLIIVRHNKSEYQMVSETIRQMRLTDAKIIGFVYNGKTSNKSYYKKGKYYYSKYYYKKHNDNVVSN